MISGQCAIGGFFIKKRVFTYLMGTILFSPSRLLIIFLLILSFCKVH